MPRLALKLIALAVTLGALQLAYAHLTGYKDAPSTVREFDKFMAEKRDIIYFGDSTLYRGRLSEGKTQTTPQILQELLPSLSVGGVYHDAYDARLFLDFCEHMTRQPHRPKAVVVPVNMRSFSLERARRPEYHFVRERLFLDNDSRIFWAFFRPLAAFGFFDFKPVTQQEYLDTKVYDGDTLIGTFKEIYAREGETLERDKLRAIYYYRLDRSHPQVQALLSIAQICERENIRPLFYLTPLDYQRGNERTESEFQERIQEKVSFLTSTLEPQAEVLDLTFSLDKERFPEISFPDAYIDDVGKRFVAERLAEAINAAQEPGH